MSKSFLSLESACYHAVHDFPGGVSGVAAVYGWNASTLQNKLNPSQTTHKILASEVSGILQLTRDPRILDAVCSQVGALWIDGPADDTPSDMAMLDNITELVKRVGDLSGSVHKSLADGSVNEREMQELETCAIRLSQSAVAVVERAKQFM